MGNIFLMNLVQIGLTVSAAALVLFALRKMMKKRYPARAVCIVWAILAVRLLLPVQLTLPEAPVQLTPRTTYLTRTDFAPAQLAQAGLPVIEQDGETTTRRWVTAEQAQALTPNDMPSLISFDLGRMLMWLWGLGMAVFAGWQVLMYCSFAYLLRSSDAPVGRNTLRRVFEEQKRSLGIARNIPLLVSPAADCPMLAGFIRPALYLPDENLSEQEAVFIFRHELVHYKRGDLWLKLLLTAAKTMHWFNPLVHLLARLAQEDIELACDDAVVRGMDGAARRAYGEAILRSAVAQSRRRSALISCFTGDKETLMRRFEGIFDTRVKKRGAALVIAATVLIGVFGCAVSVGENKDAPTDKERVALAEQWAQRGDSMDYTVKLDGDDTYVLYDIHFEYLPEVAVPYRAGERLTFEKGADGWQVVKGEAVTADADGYVTSLDEFKILYENDLGLPDFLSVPDANTQIDISMPEQAAANLLYLQGNTTVRAGAQQDIRDVAVTFADGSEVVITMIRQFGEGWLPQDFTYDGGKNARTAADLARQYARGVMHKSGQYIYPILTAQMQQDYRTAQQLPDGGFSWKYGGSSPSYRNYTLVPTSGGEYIAVFQMYGGGVDDVRSAYLVTTARADGRRVIDSVTEVAERNYTKSDLFRIYYDSGLPWPTIPEGAQRFNGASLDTLTRVQDAVETVFGYFGENAEHIEGNQHQITTERWFTSEVVSEGESEATVRLNFVDDSPLVDVQMRKTSDYWLPVGLAKQFDQGFSAYLVEGDSPVSQGALPVGATIQQAIENANGEIPLLEAGQTITLEPVDGKLTATDAVLTDAVIHADGTLRYTDKETQQTNIRFTDVYDRGSAVYLYKVEHLAAEALSSTLTAVVYHGVTVTYRTSAYTGTEKEYTAAFVYRLSNEGVPNTDYTITSTEYHNDTYGYTLTLPDCFVGQGYAVETENGVRFGLQNAMPGYSDDPTDGGTVMHLQAEATAYLRELYGEDWQANYHVPCRQLAERDGLTWYLTFASDVQYDINDEDITAAYAEMAEAARAMEGSALSFEGQTAEQRTNEQELLLRALARIYAAQNDSTAELIRDKVTIHPETGDNAVRIVIRFTTRNRDYFFTRAERVWYDRTDTITPSRTELLVDTADGVRSRADFLLAFPPEQGFPQVGRTGIDALLAAPTGNAAQDAERVLGLTGGTAEDFVHHPAYRRVTFTYRWPDGTVDFTMQGVRLGNAKDFVYLPIGYNGALWEGDPYTYMMCKETNDFSMCSVQALAAYLAQSDGAYTEGILAELDKRWQQDKAAVEQAIAGVDAPVQTLWQQHKAANPDLFGARFTAAEIEAAYQAVRAYAAANGFSVENLRYDAAHDSSFSEDSMSSGVLKDNVQEDGLTRGDVITVLGDAHFGENAWRDKAEGWAFTLYRGADGKWVLEDGAFGY